MPTSAANAMANFVEGFVKSDRGRVALDRIAQGFQIVAGAAETTFNLLNNHWDKFTGAAETGASAFTDTIAAMMGPLPNAVRRLSSAASNAARDAGRNTSRGFAEGIRGGQTEATSAATSLADSVASAFRSFLGIQSPSRLFAEYGRNTVEGFERGQEDALPGEMPLTGAASAAPSTSTISNGGNLTIQQLIVNAPSDKAEDIALAVRAEMQKLLAAMSLSRGLS